VQLPGIEKVTKLDLHAGDRIVVHLDHYPSDEEAHEIATRLPHAVGADIRVIVVPPGTELEVQPDPGAGP
jgi:hypothetical protein